MSGHSLDSSSHSAADAAAGPPSARSSGSSEPRQQGPAVSVPLVRGSVFYGVFSGAGSGNRRVGTGPVAFICQGPSSN